MPSLASKLLPALALVAATVAGLQGASAAVMPAGASFEVSAQVVAACSVDTGAGSVTAANTAVACEGTTPAMVGGMAASDLSNPTEDEAAAPAGTNAVVVVY